MPRSGLHLSFYMKLKIICVYTGFIFETPKVAGIQCIKCEVCAFVSERERVKLCQLMRARMSESKFAGPAEESK